MIAPSDSIATLNTLLQTCRDGEAGFREAAQHVSSPGVRAAFIEIAEERGRLAEELVQEVRRLGGTPIEAGSISGAVHRGWMNLKAALTAQNDAAIIAEAERGEDVAKRAYAQALKATLPPAVDSIVRRQYGRVQAAHDRVRAMETSHPSGM
jgi:uncharacterized protein (TIGR02284 family)